MHMDSNENSCTSTQSAVIQYLVSTVLSILRHFPQDQSREEQVRANSLLECARQLKILHADLPLPEYSAVWDNLRDISNLLGNELEASIAIQNMIDEPSPNGSTDIEEELIYNPDLDAEIARIQDFKEIGDQVKFKYKEIACNLKEVADQVDLNEESKAKELDRVLNKKAAVQELNSKEIARLDAELNNNTRDEENLRAKEAMLIGQLKDVQIQLQRNDTTRQGLQKWLEDLQNKHDVDLDVIGRSEQYATEQHERASSQSRSIHLVTQLIDGMYWLHTRQYGTQEQQNDHYMGNKMRTLERGYRMRIGTAFSNNNRHTEESLFASTLMIYHKVCLGHEVPKDHLEKPDRLKVAISVIHELFAIYPDTLDIFTNPPEVEQRYLYLVHDPRYVNKLRSLIPLTTPHANNAPPTVPSLPANPPPSTPSMNGNTPSPPPPPAPQEPPAHPSNLLHIDYLLDVQSETEVMKPGQDVAIPTGTTEGDSSEAERDPNLYDTFVSPLSLQAAFRAAGAVCDAVDAVMRGGYTRAFCAVRPPGHHVGRMGRTKNVPSQGFCLLNNVAVGAKYALFTAGLERIAIVDFDVHHGNGTQEILEGDSNFMFFSIHVHDPKKFFYPGTGGECTTSECGSCATTTGLTSQKNVVNVPLRRNASSGVFLNAFSQRIITKLTQFAPQLILLSAGFDGHRDDPTNGMRLGEEDYYAITKQLKKVAKKCCQGRLVSVLEGGYALEGRNSAFRRSVSAHLKALVRDDDDLEDDEANETSRRQPTPKKGSIQSLLM